METPSKELAKAILRNPHNFHDVRHGGGLSAHDAAAARFEDEGRKAYPYGRNPHAAGTMAAERWAIGWSQADNVACGAFNLDYKGWHIWHSVARNVMVVNGPTLETRHLEYPNFGAAAHILHALGWQDVANALYDAAMEA